MTALDTRVALAICDGIDVIDEARRADVDVGDETAAFRLTCKLCAACAGNRHAPQLADNLDVAVCNLRGALATGSASARARPTGPTSALRRAVHRLSRAPNARIGRLAEDTAPDPGDARPGSAAVDARTVAQAAIVRLERHYGLRREVGGSADDDALADDYFLDLERRWLGHIRSMLPEPRELGSLGENLPDDTDDVRDDDNGR